MLGLKVPTESRRKSLSSFLLVPPTSHLSTLHANSEEARELGNTPSKDAGGVSVAAMRNVKSREQAESLLPYLWSPTVPLLHIIVGPGSDLLHHHPPGPGSGPHTSCFLCYRPGSGLLHHLYPLSQLAGSVLSA